MSAVKQIKVGIIGCGVIAPCHIGSYLKLPEVRVVHLCDKVPAKAEKLAKEYGIGKVSQDYKELLADPEVDAVSICTDHASHSQIAVDALNAGKHVICEKSLASSKEKLDAMLEAARRHPGLVFSGVFQHRFPRQQSVLLKYGGKPYAVRARYRTPAGAFQPQQQPQHGGFSSAGGGHQADSSA